MNSRLIDSTIADAPPRLAEPGSHYDSSPQQAHWVEVLVDCPGAQGLYTYVIPADLAIRPGDILSVPFGPQQVGAIAIRLLDHQPDQVSADHLRLVEDVVSQGFFPPGYWALLQRVAHYYAVSLMQVIRVALPPGLLGRSQRRIRLVAGVSPDPQAIAHPAAQQILQLLQAKRAGDYTWQYLRRQVPGASAGLKQLLRQGWVTSYLAAPTPIRPKQQLAATLVTGPVDVASTARQQEILDVLKRRGGELWLQDLLQLCQTSSSTVKTLAQKGYLVIHPREVLRTDTGSPQAADLPKALTPAQVEVLAALRTIQGYGQALLHGVTGSGKTEVYLQAIAPILQGGQSVLVLVPEIGLTPQLTDRFTARFGQQVRVYHSALSDGERYDTWRQMLNGTPQIIIGTRSAVFAPLPNLGMIILDEEHDSSFKQDQPAPCYHARTVARWRAKLDQCPLILGSATPSLETWVSIGQGAIAQPASDPALPSQPETASPSLYLSLPERVQSRPLPPIQIVDMRLELQQGNRSIFSRPLQIALQNLQENDQQGILFIHRRGHSTFVSCRSCGEVLECPHCDVSLSYHHIHPQSSQLLRCHYCGYGQSQPQHCPACRSPYLKNFGSGTQRVMHELQENLPQLRCIRFDSDTTRTKGAHRALLSRFAQGEADLLVGTQMLTKGIDLPQVTLVGIVAADGLLHLADYRASERAFQTLTQVAGRAGRGDLAGQVILQTYSPDHAVIQAVQRHAYEPFIEAELEQRAALYYPPFGQLIALRLSGPDAAIVQQVADDLAARLQPTDTDSYDILGPAPATIHRVARRYRWQLLLKLHPGTTIDVARLTALRAYCPAHISLTIDVDPLHLL